ncbi:iron transporter FeoA [Christensenellaceae bacterium]|nr:iron transporter FeoA [Christensenellaceae bacterium]BDF60320.1 iron transporter FeoA [Christensenellaceae bacterium]
MPLTMARAGVRSFICKINGKDEVRRFLGNLGFVEGENVTVISEMGGNMIVSVKDARIAISKSMANRIMIKEQAS